MKVHWWATITAVYQPSFFRKIRMIESPQSFLNVCWEATITRLLQTSLIREYQNKFWIISNINEHLPKLNLLWIKFSGFIIYSVYKFQLLHLKSFQTGCGSLHFCTFATWLSGYILCLSNCWHHWDIYLHILAFAILLSQIMATCLMWLMSGFPNIIPRQKQNG